MSLRTRFARHLLRRLQRIADRRPPDFVIGNPDQPYLRRWWLIPRNRFCNVYLHHFCRSDDDRALHDHPWCNVSILLSGAYLEHTQRGRRIRTAGDIVARRPSAAHRVELLRDYGCSSLDTLYVHERPVWTLFITGPRVREWGFLCPAGWKHWRDFTAASHGRPGEVGPGCDDVGVRS